MTTTTVIACIGAITGTIALVWDFVKWSYAERVILDIHASPNMVTTTDPRTPHVMIVVTNKGKLTTTLKLLSFEVYDTKRQMKRRKPVKQSVVPNPLPGVLPHVLEPGKEWMGLVEQNNTNSRNTRPIDTAFVQYTIR
jgi:hypothetical protein